MQKTHLIHARWERMDRQSSESAMDTLQTKRLLGSVANLYQESNNDKQRTFPTLEREPNKPMRTRPSTTQETTTAVSQHSIKIGCAAAFWGDTETAAAQLLRHADLDYLVFDYLAEITMSIMAGMRLKDPASGFATDFVSNIMAPLLPDIAAKGTRIITNAGGVNPHSCASAIRQLIEQAGLELKVAVVSGDDLMPMLPELQQQNIQEMFSAAALPSSLVSVNAYLGAPGIVAALQAGADIVITGRVVDSALVLGPLVHEFGWGWEEYDKLAQGSLAGHIIECGAQCTGGNFTDWDSVPDYHNMGFPIVECTADGNFTVTKPEDTGGLVTCATVAEQLVYEIGDPNAYYLPDVICDFTAVQLQQQSTNRVYVSGAKGRGPTDQYKVSATYPDGFRLTASFVLAGIDAPAKAHKVSSALLRKASALFASKGMADFSRSHVELLGTEATYGANARIQNCREVVVKIAASHRDKRALALFSREIAQCATGMAPGITGLVGGRAKVSPVIRLFSFLLAKSSVPVKMQLDETSHEIDLDSANHAVGEPLDASTPASVTGNQDAATPYTVPLVQLAWARSGDKGDHANIGVIARQPEYLPYINAALSPQSVGQYMAHCFDGEPTVRAWPLPGIQAINFLLENSLGGGGICSLRIDPQGKAYAQQLLDFPVPVSAAIYQQLQVHTQDQEDQSA